MSVEYTPITGQVREAYRYASGFRRPVEEFDRWIAQHDREVSARAWWVGIEAQWKHRPIGNRMPETLNPYREEAS